MVSPLQRDQAGLMMPGPGTPILLDATTFRTKRLLALTLSLTVLAGLLIGLDVVLRQASFIGAFAFLALAGVITALILSRRSVSDARQVLQHLAEENAILLRAKQVAESANLAKSRYLASVSHEIRSPLNAIYGYAQLLERGDQAKAEEAGRVILRCSEHLTNLVEGLLDISQLEFGMLRVRSEEIRFAPFLDQIVSMMRPSAAAKGLAFIYETPERMPEFVRLDQSRFRQVLINLLSNAIKFTDQGSVTFRVGYSGQIATFEIRDTGPGIAAEDHERIFGRFERIEGSGGPTRPGAGLGLPIARTIVEILGGKLELESEIGEGAIFRITMMLGAVSGRSIPVAPARRLVGYEGCERSILLVEDDSDQRLFLERLLRSLGFAVSAHASGETALAAIEEGFSIDLAILDISLPGLSGWEVGTTLRRAFGPALQILMLSANSEELHQPECDTPAHDRFLVKPVEFAPLAETIGDMLGLTWHDDTDGGAGQALIAGATAERGHGGAMEDDAMSHILRLREFLRIGYVRGIEAEIRLLELAAPDAKLLVRRLYDYLDRYDLAGMARLLQEY